MKANLESRGTAFIIDAVISFFVIFLLFGKCIFTENFIGSMNFYLITIGYVILFALRDSFGGAGIGKRLMHIYVGDCNEPSKSVPTYKLFLRNLFDCIWPLEFIILMLSKEDMLRLGDKLTGTAVFTNRNYFHHRRNIFNIFKRT